MKIETKTVVKIGIGIFILYLCTYYWPTVSGLLLTLFEALVPLIIGCAIAYIVNLIMGFYEGLYFAKSKSKAVIKTRRPVCLLGAIISLIAFIAIIMTIVVPQLVSCVQLLFAKLPESLNAAVKQIEAWGILPADIMATLNSLDWNSIIGKGASFLTSGITNIVGAVVNVVSSVIGGFITAFVSVIFAVYLLLDKEKLGGQFNRVMQRFLPQKKYSMTATASIG
jgi:predicted PurR-regulated permease PerM